MAEAVEEEVILTEVQRLMAHRARGLVELGFSPKQAFKLRRRPDVVHDAQDLLARGAPHSFVVSELSED